MTATPPALWTWRQGSALPPAPQAQPQQQRSIHALHKPANLTRQLQPRRVPADGHASRQIRQKKGAWERWLPGPGSAADNRGLYGLPQRAGSGRTRLVLNPNTRIGERMQTTAELTINIQH